MTKNLLLLLPATIVLHTCSQTPPHPRDSEPDTNEVRVVDKAITDESIAVTSHTRVDSTKLIYSWLDDYNVENTLVNRIATPPGHTRVPLDFGSFENWLRHLPLKPGLPNIKLYNKQDKWTQDVHVGVVDMDVDEVDLQQCADAVMRLKAEYHYQAGEYEAIHFNYMCGDEVGYSDWIRGKKPVPVNRSVIWRDCSGCNTSYRSFRKYLTQIYNYAGTISLERELKPKAWKDIEVGDVVIQGGSPGHAISVVDVAVNEETGDKAFLLVQSYMPAQESHVLKNPNNEDISPWYSVSDIKGTYFQTPEWLFPYESLRGFTE